MTVVAFVLAVSSTSPTVSRTLGCGERRLDNEGL